jgi:hypothetical protein
MPGKLPVKESTVTVEVKLPWSVYNDLRLIMEEQPWTDLQTLIEDMVRDGIRADRNMRER